MSYTPVKTVGTGDPWTALDMNTYVRANFAAGIPDIMTAAGDLVSASAADVGVVLPVSAINDSILIVDHANPGKIGWRTPAAAKSYQGTQPFTSGVARVERFSFEEFDTDSKQAAPNFDWVFTIPRTGYYLILCYLNFVESGGSPAVWTAANEPILADVRVGATIKGTIGIKSTQAAGTFKFCLPGMDIFHFTVNDVATMYITQYSGSSAYLSSDTLVAIKYLGS